MQPVASKEPTLFLRIPRIMRALDVATFRLIAVYRQKASLGRKFKILLVSHPNVAFGTYI